MGLRNRRLGASATEAQVHRVRIGVFVDAGFNAYVGGDGRRRITSPVAFVRFATEVSERFLRATFFGRTKEVSDGDGEFELPRHARIVELPHYPSLRSPGPVLRSFLRSGHRMWRGLDDVDCVWVFGPNPFGLLLIGIALIRRRRVILGVRQDTKRYFRARLDGAQSVARGLAWLGSSVFELLGRVLPTTVVGATEPGRQQLSMTVLLIRRGDMARAPADRDWSGPISLISIGRIEREKNPMLLIELMEELERRRPGRFRLTWVGGGAMEDEVRNRAARSRAPAAIEFRGFMPFGQALLSLYRSAHALVHVSLTEGRPQVITEAMACGVPIVATDVGGVGELLREGPMGRLVPPRDLDSLVAAIESLVEDPGATRQMGERALHAARRVAIDIEASRVARFIASA